MQDLAQPSFINALNALFKPENAAVIGSMTAGKHGLTALRYLKKGGFPGGIFPINPSGGTVEGLEVHRSIADVPVRVDCALLVVPATATAEAVRQCAERGVRSIVIGATGFAELGTEEGRARQEELLRIARAAGMRVVGPNTNGIYNASARFSLGYNTSHGDPLTPGPVSIAAHSGALFNSIAPRLREVGVGLSKFVPVGNEADLSMLDFIEYFIEDEDTRIIGLIVEGISDGARFRELLQRARAAGKPVVALKLGRSRAGAGATEAHSSRLAGSARAFDAVFRDYGVASVPTVEALAGACGVLLATKRGSASRNTSLVCVTTTGGGSSMLADFAAARGLSLAGNPDGSWGGRIAETIATFTGAGTVRNPTDTGSLGGRQDRLQELFEAQEAEGYSGPVMVFTHSLPTVKGSQGIADMLIARKERTGSPVVVVAPGNLAEPIVEKYRAAGIPFFLDVATAFDSLQAYYDVVAADACEKPSRSPVLEELTSLLAKGEGILSELESAEVLRRAGLSIVTSVEVKSAEEARTAAQTAGFPVVLKALAPGVAHKNKLGLVIAGIADAAALEQSFALLQKRVKALSHEDGVKFILQPMIKGTAELIVGVSWEEPLGHFLVAGLGGIYTEVLDEVVLLPVPVARQLMKKRLEEARIGRLVKAIGGEALLDRVLDTLGRLQDVILAHGARVRSIDINPLLIGEKICVGVDALVVTGEVPKAGA